MNVETTATAVAFTDAGCQVTQAAEYGNALRVVKGSVSLLVFLTETGAFGTAHRTDVHPHHALTIRTRKAAIKAIA